MFWGCPNMRRPSMYRCICVVQYLRTWRY